MATPAKSSDQQSTIRKVKVKKKVDMRRQGTSSGVKEYQSKADEIVDLVVQKITDNPDIACSAFFANDENFEPMQTERVNENDEKILSSKPNEFQPHHPAFEQRYSPLKTESIEPLTKFTSRAPSRSQYGLPPQHPMSQVDQRSEICAQSCWESETVAESTFGYQNKIIYADNYEYEIVSVKYYYLNGKKKKRVKKKKKRLIDENSDLIAMGLIEEQSTPRWIEKQQQQEMGGPPMIGPKARSSSVCSHRPVVQSKAQQLSAIKQSRQRKASIDQKKEDIKLPEKEPIIKLEQTDVKAVKEPKPVLITQLGIQSQEAKLKKRRQQIELKYGKYPLHRMIFKKEYQTLASLFVEGVFTVDDTNLRDHNGNTPLHLAVKLSQRDTEYLKAVNYLFDKGANGKLRDASGWAIMHDAISMQIPTVVAVVFERLNKAKYAKWDRNRPKIIQRLRNIPDFYVELHWEFQSTLLPFLAKLSPNDTYKIWKVGSFLRLDFSLVGYEKLKQKRRNMSIVFRDRDECLDTYTNIDIMLINKDRKIIVNPLEDLDDEEKLAVLTDLINSDPMQGEFKITDQNWAECKGFFGGGISEQLGQYHTQKHRLRVNTHTLTKKKITRSFDYTYDQYFDGIKDTDSPVREEMKQNIKVHKDVKKQVDTYLWLCHEFPLKIQEFLTVLDTLQLGGNASMQKLNEFLQNDTMKEVISEHGFPVKVQIPVGFSIRATVQFSQFQYLEGGIPDHQNIFRVPEDCVPVCRKEGMKTLKNKKKRLALANLAT